MRIPKRPSTAKLDNFLRKFAIKYFLKSSGTELRIATATMRLCGQMKWSKATGKNQGWKPAISPSLPAKQNRKQEHAPFREQTMASLFVSPTFTNRPFSSLGMATPWKEGRKLHMGSVQHTLSLAESRCEESR